MNDGMLFVVGAQDGYNFTSTAPLDNSAGWDVAIRDTTATSFSAMESALWSFVYVDYDAPGLIGGRVAAGGNIVHEEGDFAISHPSTGVYQISITGYTPADASILAANWTAASESTAAPEPSTAILLGGAILALAGAQRRRFTAAGDLNYRQPQSRPAPASSQRLAGFFGRDRSQR